MPSTQKRPDGRQSPPFRQRTLAQTLASVLRHKTMRIRDAADAALKAGYETRAGPERFYNAVALVLRGPCFRRVSRGRYTAIRQPVVRPTRGPKSLVPLLERLLRRKVMSVKQLVREARKAGARTTARSLRGTVTSALCSPQFRRLAHGWYTSDAHPANRRSRVK